MNRCPDLVVCLKRDLQRLRPEANLVLIYRPNVAGMKGRVDLAYPINITPDLWRGSTRHYHSILFDRFGNKNILTNAHLSNLLNLSPVRNSTDIVGLRNLYDRESAETQISSLEGLGVKGGSYSILLTPILLKQIPFGTRFGIQSF
ncbi:uncharacterized protein TNCV_4763961 [Trichonephila clavipes]|nr:uncharacterized protein TNCV_4763961 [Trichonephila clavipes]